MFVVSLIQSSVRQVVIAIHNEDATDACEALERYVFQLEFLLPETDVRNRDLMYVYSCSLMQHPRKYLKIRSRSCCATIHATDLVARRTLRTGR